MPTIGELIRRRMDVLGASYRDLAKKVDDEVNATQLHRWVQRPPTEFPKPRTVEALARLLDVPVATILMGFAEALGLPVKSTSSTLAAILPPGTDSLTPEDREVIRVVTRALINARTDSDTAAGEAAARRVTELHPPRPDLRRVAARRGESEGQRLRDQQDREVD